MSTDIAFILGTMLLYAAPLIYTSLGGLLSENSGVVNIGLEGMMTLGAFVGAAVGIFTGNPWLSFLAAGLSSMMLGLLHAFACVTLRANNIISGIALNFIGPGLAFFLSRLLFKGATNTPPIPLENKMPRPFNNLFITLGEKLPSPFNEFFVKNSFGDILINQYVTVYIAIGLAILMHIFFYYTKYGMHLRAVGEDPTAAKTRAIKVVLIRYLAVSASGFFAGLGGASISLAVVASFWKPLISGQGFTALAALIFGKWRPIPTLFACFIFGAAQGLVVFLGSRLPGEYTNLLSMIPYLLTLIILITFIGRGMAPSAIGKPLEEKK